jgi:hypothetical protein
MDWVLWLLLGICIVAIVAHWRISTITTETEGFVTMGGGFGGLNINTMTNQALDSAPTTSEVKQHYTNLLLFADSDIRQSGTKALRILADFRDRCFAQPNFRDNLTVDDILANWPDWLPPLDPTMKEPSPSVEDAVTAELKMLAYLQKNFPQEDLVDEQTGSTIRNLIQDFGLRFVFESPPVQLRSDFLAQPLLANWRNPAAGAG